MKTLYFECTSGISGDMTAAALLDLGADEKKLRKALESLHLDGWHLHISRTSKCGIDACDFDVHLEDDPHAAAHTHSHDTLHDHDHDHVHDHDHDHGHDHDHHHPHVHRNLADCLAILRGGDLTPHALELAEKIFTVLAEAESRAHGVPVEQVHFHEVGAVDSIVDIAAAAICLDDLGADRLIFGNIREGSGTVWCQHGRMPVPVPATLNLLTAAKAPFTVCDVDGEMITPTGAAILAALADSFQKPAAMRVRRVGIGAGKKDFPHANILRVYELEESEDADRVLLMEANVDDSTGEELGYAMEQFFTSGALDCWFEPIQMKKNRPAVKLSVLCREEDRTAMASLAFTHTSTIGVRFFPADRITCRRRLRTVETSYGSGQVKEITYPGGNRITAEYESAKALAQSAGIPLRTALKALEAAAD